MAAKKSDYRLEKKNSFKPSETVSAYRGERGNYEARTLRRYSYQGW
jgi:hypothetical protein